MLNDITIKSAPNHYIQGVSLFARTPAERKFFPSKIVWYLKNFVQTATVIPRGDFIESLAFSMEPPLRTNHDAFLIDNHQRSWPNVRFRIYPNGLYGSTPGYFSVEIVCDRQNTTDEPHMSWSSPPRVHTSHKNGCTLIKTEPFKIGMEFSSSLPFFILEVGDQFIRGPFQPAIDKHSGDLLGGYRDAGKTWDIVDPVENTLKLSLYMMPPLRDLTWPPVQHKSTYLSPHSSGDLLRHLCRIGVRPIMTVQYVQSFAEGAPHSWIERESVVAGADIKDLEGLEYETPRSILRPDSSPKDEKQSSPQKEKKMRSTSALMGSLNKFGGMFDAIDSKKKSKNNRQPPSASSTSNQSPKGKKISESKKDFESSSSDDSDSKKSKPRPKPLMPHRSKHATSLSHRYEDSIQSLTIPSTSQGSSNVFNIPDDMLPSGISDVDELTSEQKLIIRNKKSAFKMKHRGNKQKPDPSDAPATIDIDENLPVSHADTCSNPPFIDHIGNPYAPPNSIPSIRSSAISLQRDQPHYQLSTSPSSLTNKTVSSISTSFQLKLSPNPYDWLNRARPPRTLLQGSIQPIAENLLRAELPPQPPRWKLVDKGEQDPSERWHPKDEEHRKRQQRREERKQMSNVASDLSSSAPASWMQEPMPAPKKKEIFDGIQAAVKLDENIRNQRPPTWDEIQLSKWKIPDKFKLYPDLPDAVIKFQSQRYVRQTNSPNRPPSEWSIRRRDEYLDAYEKEFLQPDNVHWTRSGKEAHFNDEYFRRTTHPSLRRAFGAQLVDRIIFEERDVFTHGLETSRSAVAVGNLPSDQELIKDMLEEGPGGQTADGIFTQVINTIGDFESKQTAQKTWTDFIDTQISNGFSLRGLFEIDPYQGNVTGNQNDAVTETNKEVVFDLPVQEERLINQPSQQNESKEKTVSNKKPLSNFDWLGSNENNTDDDKSKKTSLKIKSNHEIEVAPERRNDNNILLAQMGNLGDQLQNAFNNLPSVSIPSWGGWDSWWTGETTDNPTDEINNIIVAKKKKKKKKSK